MASKSFFAAVTFPKKIFSSGFLTRYIPPSCRTISSESKKHRRRRIPRSVAFSIPSRRAVYSAMLLVCMPRNFFPAKISLPPSSKSANPAPAMPGFPRAPPSEKSVALSPNASFWGLVATRHWEGSAFFTSTKFFVRKV